MNCLPVQKALLLVAAMAVCIPSPSADAQTRKARQGNITVQSDRDASNFRVSIPCAATDDDPQPTPAVRWVLGIEEFWFDYEGMNLDRLSPDSPLLRLNELPDRRGRRFYLEPGDVITHIEGKPIRSLSDYVMALHTSLNPRNLTITIINGRDGAVMTLYGGAKKLPW